MPTAASSRRSIPGDTLRATSEVIGLKENSNRQTGVVYVRSRGFNQRGETVLDYVRWVMVRKRDPNAPAPAEVTCRNLPKRWSPRPSSATPARSSTPRDYDASLAGLATSFGRLRCPASASTMSTA